MIDAILEKNIVPDAIIRKFIQRLNRGRLKDEKKWFIENLEDYHQLIRERHQGSAIAENTRDANEQHYEVPSEFYQLVLGDNLKYSSCFYTDENNTLSQAETDMLRISCERAEVKDKMHILDLGCGWGSMTFYLAQNFKDLKITSVSNSKTQKKFIEEKAKLLGLKNIQVITEDINKLKLTRKFDRIISVEMFEHVRNYPELFKKVSTFLKPRGKLFVHIFTHKEYSYYFEPKDTTDWMARYFFTGGVMPSNHLFYYFCEPLKIEKHWLVNGRHYHLTSEAWLKNIDKNREAVMQIFSDTYGEENALKWYSYWRIFFIAVSELFKTRNGNEWMVNHYLFSR